MFVLYFFLLLFFMIPMKKKSNLEEFCCCCCEKRWKKNALLIIKFNSNKSCVLDGWIFVCVFVCLGGVYFRWLLWQLPWFVDAIYDLIFSWNMRYMKRLFFVHKYGWCFFIFISQLIKFRIENLTSIFCYFFVCYLC